MCRAGITLKCLQLDSRISIMTLIALLVLLALLALLGVLQLAVQEYIQLHPCFKKMMPINNIQEEYSVRFTLLFQAHCAQMQRVDQNLVELSTKNISEVESNIFFSFGAQNEFEVVWQFSSQLLSIQMIANLILSKP